MKQHLYIILAIVALTLYACDSFNEADDAHKVAPLSVKVKLNVETEGLTLRSMLMKFDNYDEGYHLEKEFEGETINMDDIVPGIYSVTVSGAGVDAENNEYYVNGNAVNQAIYGDNPQLDISLQGLKVSPLVFKEIYYAGSRTPSEGVWFRDQFYEIYNNSAEVQYLDGVYFANLTPNKSTKKLPLWPEEDGNNYAYAERIWKFPGDGSDYPLQPGESCVIAQFAANQKLEQYNPNSPVDLSSAEFEFNMNNANFPDQPATDMVHVFYNGKAAKGSIPQYLTSVFGGAYVIFRVPEGETYDPVGDATMKTTDLSKPNSKTYYAKIPVSYVLDAVECIDNESMSSAKRVPAVLDAGMTWVGATYCGLGVARKPQTDEDGEYIKRANGAMIFQDTNNSTDDFERGVTPQLRRYDTGIPSWNNNK